MRWRNWAGNQRAAGIEVRRPRGTGEIATVLHEATVAGRRVRPIGSGHSFSGIGRPEQVQLVLDRHADLVDITPDGLVTVQAGMTLHRLNGVLAREGWALTNLGDIDRQTVAGALSTGTHGTGAAFGGLATQVRALQLVTADGTVLDCSADQHPDVFSAARLGLGALGVLSTVTLQAVPAFALAMVEQPMPLAEVLADLDGFMTSADHVEFHWFGHTTTCLTKRNTRVPLSEGLTPLPRWQALWEDEVLANAAYAGVIAAGRAVPALVPPLARFASTALSPRSATDLSHRVFVSTRRFRFRECEYAVPRDAVPDLLRELGRLTELRGWRLPIPTEVRYAAADDVPLSTAQGRDTAYVAVHVPARSDPTDVFATFEGLAGEVGGRPHWGKEHGLDAAVLAQRYPRFGEFVAVRDRLDPAGTLSNAYLERVLGAPAGPR
ncbi:D-arabinono-1,4-lactone oxidase [Klenkia sp. PcliD-1-E]|uniref:D-arabinono-1,4-lactone oxidase n=1 Tax=Klenkia sp. PcliD-1-E TaxID=2954492 RepID=UPI0020977D07|nr:D-arabinono-1,4-lactone oxidase [Klenkia sp. PcliD-1-E]MCO7221658.1 FAD-binding protein [Klenkia sp. PcliD-1-E]